MEEVRNVMKKKFEERFHVKLKTGTLSKKEKELTKISCQNIIPGVGISLMEHDVIS